MDLRTLDLDGIFVQYFSFRVGSKLRTEVDLHAMRAVAFLQLESTSVIAYSHLLQLTSPAGIKVNCTQRNDVSQIRPKLFFLKWHLANKRICAKCHIR